MKKTTFNEFPGKRLLKTAICFVAMLLFCSLAYAQTEPADENDSECPTCPLLSDLLEKGYGISFEMHNVNENKGAELRTATAAEMEITSVSIRRSMEDIVDSKGNSFLIIKAPYYDNGTLIDPIVIQINKINTVSVNVKYSLHTFKQKYLKDNKYNTLSALATCPNILMTTLKEIDDNLDEIYEFGTVNETSSTTSTTFNWDGKTNSKNGSLPVRACLYLVARNADNGELIGTAVTNIALQTYTITFPIATFTPTPDKDGKETISAKIVLAFDDRPVKLTAVLLTTPCGLGFATYDMVNKGAEAIIASINSSAFGAATLDIIAYKELTNPVVDSKNNLVKTYKWEDIKTINWGSKDPKAPKTIWQELLSNPKGDAGGGWEWIYNAQLDGEDYFAPTEAQNNRGYLLGLIVEGFDKDGNPIETFTGVNEGYIYNTGLFEIPMLTNPKSIYTGIEAVKNEGISIGALPNGNLNIICNNGDRPESYAIHDLTGKLVKSGKLSGAAEETIATNLHTGFFVIQIVKMDGGVSVQKVVVK